MTAYVLIFGAALLGAGCGIMTKCFQARAANGLKAEVLVIVLCCAIKNAVIFPINGFSMAFSWYSFLLGLLSVTVGTVALLLTFQMLRMGGLAVATVFSTLGSMTVPYFFGLIFLDEKLTWLRGAGLAVMAAAIVLTGKGSKDIRNKRAYFALCAAVFFLQGCNGIVSKLQQLPANAHLAIPAMDYVLLSSLTQMIALAAIYLFLLLRDRSKAPESRSPMPHFTAVVWVIITARALFDGFSYLLQLYSASDLPATVMFPILTGGNIVLMALAGRLLFGERLKKKALAGVLLCFAATFMFL